MREKLIKLLINSPGLDVLFGGKEEFAENADWLIANGVTVQKWISAKDRLPTPYMPVLTYKQHLGKQQPFMTVDYITIGYSETKIWAGEIGTWKREVTHWMPLPHPPKGE